jgi:hypothetical protein
MAGVLHRELALALPKKIRGQSRKLQLTRCSTERTSRVNYGGRSGELWREKCLGAASQICAVAKHVAECHFANDGDETLVAHGVLNQEKTRHVSEKEHKATGHAHLDNALSSVDARD